MPRMIYGTAWKEQRTKGLVIRAFLAGFRGVDTACQPKHYNQALVGEALIELAEQHDITRDQVFIQTKFTQLRGHDPQRVPYDPVASLTEQVAQSFAVSQAELRIKYVDSLVMHSPCSSHGQTMEVWRAMEAIYEVGCALRLGISNVSLEELTAICKDAKVQPSVVQNRFYASTKFDTELRAFCAAHDPPMVYQSFWSLTANPTAVRSATVTQAAARLGETNEQAFYRFLMQQDIVPLSGTCDPEHMQQDVAVLQSVEAGVDGLLAEEIVGIRQELGIPL